MAKITTEKLIDVRYSETDQMGVVHHASYIVYFEAARIDWLTKLGFSYKKMEEGGVMLPVVSLNTKFKKSAFFGDTLNVITTLKEIPCVKIEFFYEIFNQKGELLTEGDTILFFLDAEKRKPMKCPANLLEAITNYSESSSTP